MRAARTNDCGGCDPPPTHCHPQLGKTGVLSPVACHRILFLLTSDLIKWTSSLQRTGTCRMVWYGMVRYGIWCEVKYRTCCKHYTFIQ